MVKAAKVDNTASDAYLARKLAVGKKDVIKSPTAKLMINIDGADADGNDISQHVGKFHIAGTNLYSKTIKLRPLILENKLVKMTKGKGPNGAAKWSYVNESVFFLHYGETIYDRKGGIACGKVFGDAKKALSEAAKEENDNKASSFLYIFGLADFGDGVQHLVDFRVGGKRIIAFSDAMSWKTVPKGSHMSQFAYNLKCVPVSGTSHPKIEIAFNQDEILPIDAEVIAADEAVNAYIDAHNAQIMESYKRYNSQAAETVVDDSLEIGDDE